MLQSTLEKLHTLNFFSKCVNFGSKSTHFEFFSKNIDIVDINALRKNIIQGLVKIIIFYIQGMNVLTLFSLMGYF